MHLKHTMQAITPQYEIGCGHARLVIWPFQGDDFYTLIATAQKEGLPRNEVEIINQQEK